MKGLEQNRFKLAGTRCFIVVEIFQKTPIFFLLKSECHALLVFRLCCKGR